MRLSLIQLEDAITKLADRTRVGSKLSGQEFADEVLAIARAAESAIKSLSARLDKLESGESGIGPTGRMRMDD
ncbi:hypothetical protein Q2941_12320 [Bradyrhizobium sp. UFLA05-153]